MKQNKNQKNKKINNQEISHEDIPKNTKATARRLLGRLSRQKGKVAVILAAAILSSMANAFIPITVGVAIDGLIGGLLGLDGTVSPLEMAAEVLLMPILIIVAISIVSCLLSYLQQYTVSGVGEQLTLSLRRDISEKLTRLPLRFFDSHQTGDLLSRTTNDLEKVAEVMQVGFMQFITSSITIITTIIVMLWVSPRLTLIVLLTISASSIGTMLISGKNQRCFAENQAAVGAINSRIEELYTGNRIIKVFNNQPQAIESVLDLNQRQYEAAKKAQFVNYAIYPAIRLLNQLGFVVTAVAGGAMVIQGRVSIGAIQAFLQYVNQVSEPITEAAYVINSLQSAIAGAERVFGLLDETEESADEPMGASLYEGSGRVDFHHVQFGYTPERQLMKDISFAVKPNEMVAIVGPTGGGKTTLINLLMRFYELNGGKISIDGRDIKEVSRGELRRRIGMVLQDTWLFEGTVAENIAYGRQDAGREEIIAAAKAARCDYFIRTLPQGYDTVISSEASVISQGQMQLLTIARAMLTNPSIMILDEATSSVDTRTEVEIQKAMGRLMRDKTSFVIAHRLSTIQNANLILVVKDGDIVESGTHASLLEKKGFYASLYYSQFELSA